MQVELDDSFVKNIANLSNKARHQIGAIIKNLESDEYYQPHDDHIICSRNEIDNACACQHLSEWGDWKLVWYYEYSATYTSTVETVVIMLVEEPLQARTLRKKSR